MVRRSRLSRSSRLPEASSRLRRDFAEDMRMYSDKMLDTYAKEPKGVLAVDPVMQMMRGLAVAEKARRKELRKQWGKFTVQQGALQVFASETGKRMKFFKEWLALPEHVYEGRLEHDAEHAANYFFDKLDHFLHKGRDAKERWHSFATAHGLANKTSTDFIKAGYDVVNRYPYDTDTEVLKRNFLHYREKYPKMVVVPSVVDNKRYYDIMVRMKT